MRNCFSSRRTITAVAVVSVFATLTYCTEVNDKLGIGFIPDDQNSSLGVDSIGLKDGETIRASINYIDTIYTMNQTVGMFGRTRNDLFGGMTSATVMQFQPTSDRVDTTSHGFGYGATVDSVMFVGSILTMTGDNSVEQTFNIYRMKDSLRADTSHYISYDWRGVVDENEPLFTFKYSGQSNDNEIEFIKTEITDAGRLFVNELISDTTWYVNTDNATGDEVVEARKRFREVFYGLVLAPAPGSPDAATYYMSLSYGYLNLYLHNYEDEGLDVIKDEDVLLSFYFDDSSSFSPRNNSVVCVEHDFDNTIFAGTTYESGPQPVTSGKSYVQGMGGIVTGIEFPDGFFEAMDSIRMAKNASELFISQAKLYIWLDNPAQELQVINDAHQRFGSYFKYGGVYPSVIPDYSYYDEASGSTIAYGGYLNRTHGYYEFTITSYMHFAYRDYMLYKEGKYEEGDERINKYTLAPVAYPTPPNQALSWKETTLVVSDAETNPALRKQPFVRLTYLLID